MRGRPVLERTNSSSAAGDELLLRLDSRRAVEAVIVGASQLLSYEKEGPGRIVQVLMDYHGTTAAALTTMVDRGFADAVHAGLEAAALKVAAMAKK